MNKPCQSRKKVAVDFVNYYPAPNGHTIHADPIFEPDDVDVVPVEGTKQTAAILKDKATAIPKELKPVIEALRELETPEAITPADLNECLDVVAARGAKDGPAKRKARQRYREKLEADGVLEPVEDDNGKLAFYRFHDTVAV